MNNFKIFPKNTKTNDINTPLLKGTVIIAHLFYEDKFNKNFDYLKQIDKNIDIYIVTANDGLELIAKKKIETLNIKNIKVIKKINRGRDFAALFIECKQIIKKYEYICFVHDKRSHKGDVFDFGDTWSKCLLENTIGSNEYVYNVIDCFIKNNDIGILSAPIPPEEYLLGLRGATWTCNEENSISFLKKLGIVTKININEDSCTIGSCFWFRIKALNKIIDYDLKYEDFPEEPMPVDGCIAHAIERCLSYISCYEGYKNYYILNSEYSEYYLSMINDQLTKSISVLRKENVLCYSDSKTDLDETLEFVSKKKTYSRLEKYCLHSRRVFVIEDESNISQQCINELRNKNIQIECIYNISNVDYQKISELPYGIVICAKDKDEVIQKLKNCSFGIKPFIYV